MSYDPKKADRGSYFDQLFKSEAKKDQPKTIVPHVKWTDTFKDPSKHGFSHKGHWVKGSRETFSHKIIKEAKKT